MRCEENKRTTAESGLKEVPTNDVGDYYYIPGTSTATGPSRQEKRNCSHHAMRFNSISARHYTIHMQFVLDIQVMAFRSCF